MISRKSSVDSNTDTTLELRGAVFAILAEVLPAHQIDGKIIKADPSNGRPGMTQWQILDLAEGYLKRADQTRQIVNSHDPLSVVRLCVLNDFMQHDRRQIDQIDRRVLRGERIAHNEEVFSLFEPHTEWISKGKAGVPVELGLRVCIMEDRDRFILHHRVMVKSTDDKVAFAMVGETKQKFPTLRAVSMDKGFYSPANQETLKPRLDCVVLP